MRALAELRQELLVSAEQVPFKLFKLTLSGNNFLMSKFEFQIQVPTTADRGRSQTDVQRIVDR